MLVDLHVEYGTMKTIITHHETQTIFLFGKRSWVMFSKQMLYFQCPSQQLQLHLYVLSHTQWALFGIPVALKAP